MEQEFYLREFSAFKLLPKETEMEAQIHRSERQQYSVGITTSSQAHRVPEIL